MALKDEFKTQGDFLFKNRSWLPILIILPGLYIYDSTVIEITKSLQPSDRGELEITDVNIEYLKRSQLQVQIIGRGVAWLDTGTPKSLVEASIYISGIEFWPFDDSAEDPYPYPGRIIWSWNGGASQEAQACALKGNKELVAWLNDTESAVFKALNVLITTQLNVVTTNM